MIFHAKTQRREGRQEAKRDHSTFGDAFESRLTRLQDFPSLLPFAASRLRVSLITSANFERGTGYQSHAPESCISGTDPSRVRESFD